MSNFATETHVRVRLQLADTTLVPTELVETAITDAHAEILRALAPEVDVDPPAEALVVGETLLAGAHVCRALAVKQAVDQVNLVVGGQRIEDGGRFAALTAAAELAERHAWYVLEPYLAGPPELTRAAVTSTTPILGEEV